MLPRKSDEIFLSAVVNCGANAAMTVCNHRFSLPRTPEKKCARPGILEDAFCGRFHKSRIVVSRIKRMCAFVVYLVSLFNKSFFESLLGPISRMISRQKNLHGFMIAQKRRNVAPP